MGCYQIQMLCHEALSLKSIGMETAFFWYVTLMAVVAFLVSLTLHRKGKGMRL